MIRCRHEVTEHAFDKKHEDSRELPLLAPRRMAFEDVLSRDGDAWRRIAGAEELRRVAGRVQREVKAGDFERFVGWVCSNHGAGLARAAGLQIAPLKLSVA